jgi:putative tryptophan/tyrosine transport system substrate-binding protein
MRRRDFLTLLGGAAAWPLAARAQQEGRARQIAILMAGLEDSRGPDARLAAMREGLAKLGWIEGRNLRIAVRFIADDTDRRRAFAAELVALAPDVLVTNASTTQAVQALTQTIPIVIAQGGDPVAAGLIKNIVRPEGNITAFSAPEPSIAGKWLELLKEAAPHLTRVAVLFNPEFGPTAPTYLAAIEAAAPALGMQVIRTPVRNAIEAVRAIDAFAVEPNGGLLVLPPSTGLYRETIVPLAEEHRLPAIYPVRENVVDGGLMCYAQDILDQYRRAASYVDRLLRGAKVAELPVQYPTSYQLVINLKAAKAIGLTIPGQLLLRASELIE